MLGRNPAKGGVPMDPLARELHGLDLLMPLVGVPVFVALNSL